MIKLISRFSCTCEGFFESKEAFLKYLEDNDIRYVEGDDGVIMMFDGTNSYGGWIDDVELHDFEINKCEAIEYLRR